MSALAEERSIDTGSYLLAAGLPVQVVDLKDSHGLGWDVPTAKRGCTMFSRNTARRVKIICRA